MLCLAMEHAIPESRGYAEQLSSCAWNEAPSRPAPNPLHRAKEFGITRQPLADWGPARLYHQVRLAQMQDSQGDDGVTLDIFIELALAFSKESICLLLKMPLKQVSCTRYRRFIGFINC